jgi:hypothetical protein
VRIAEGREEWWSGKDSNLHGTSRPAGYSRVLCRMSVRSELIGGVNIGSD